MSEIDNCFKCGSVNLYRNTQVKDSPALISPIYTIECADCQCLVFGYTYDEVTEAWNTRPLEDSIKADHVPKSELRAWCESEKQILKDKIRERTTRVEEGQIIHARWRLLDDILEKFCKGEL